MENAEIDLRTIAAYLGASIDEQSFRKDLLGEDDEHGTPEFTGRMLDDEVKAPGPFRRFLGRLKR